ncbi:hypothetical protein RND81_07G138100 [Saponaria officinalis]|uniref:Receptor-like serine/threonine-protein kinase n=1 Tax=Saponaria officinalis TaxID=3572 RepID=A0AAW1JSL1_SAPOF
MKISTILIIFLCSSPVFATSTDTLTTNDSLKINQTLISSSVKFEMGFFNRGNPKKYYLGIWYKDIPAENIIVWVANRDSPLLSESSYLKLGNKSNILLFNGGNFVNWKTHESNGVNPILQLLDSGNLVIREAGDPNPDNFIWQSFDYPTDTLIPGQKLGWNLKTGLDLFLTSWRGSDDPGVGNFTFSLDYHGDPEIYMRDDNEIIYRSGPWVGQRFSGVPEMKSGDNGFNFNFVRTPNEIYYIFELPPDDRIKSRLIVTYDGYLQRWTRNVGSNQWTKFWFARGDQCDDYRVCGPYAICNTSDIFVCQCPQGFRTENPSAWNLGDGVGGCIRDTQLDCESDGFLTVYNIKLPETTTAYMDVTLNLDQCRDLCKRNCNCTAFASADFVQGVGSGCVIWTDYLTDMRDYVDGGQTFYMRLAAADLGGALTPASPRALAPAGPHLGPPLFSGNKKKTEIIIGVTAVSGIATLVAIVYFLCRRKAKKEKNITASDIFNGNQSLDKFEELPLFKFDELAAATSNFQESSKIGRGGFGLVYRGTLEDGQEVAIKRLSGTSRQGVEEFMNEVLLISKLQHRNLVKLLGCCVERQERMLVYDYMPNKSLDAFIFDPKKKGILDWKKCYTIIEGICRGLLYLHRDSRLKIIHRDLKAANILLDENLNPKISDFGMARIFGASQSEADTTRVVGTYGYMPPEYAIEGRFSEKSDVFSFGVLLLEIITGKRTRWHDESSLSLLGYVWKQWTENNVISLIDPVLAYQGFEAEISKCIHIGLLCVQEYAQDRPDISAVILHLSALDTASFQKPKPPGFTRFMRDTSSTSTQSHETSSMNRLSITNISGR